MWGIITTFPPSSCFSPIALHIFVNTVAPELNFSERFFLFYFSISSNHSILMDWITNNICDLIIMKRFVIILSLVVTYEDKLNGESEEDGFEGENCVRKQAFFFASWPQRMLQTWSWLWWSSSSSKSSSWVRMVMMIRVSMTLASKASSSKAQTPKGAAMSSIVRACIVFHSEILKTLWDNVLFVMITFSAGSRWGRLSSISTSASAFISASCSSCSDSWSIRSSQSPPTSKPPEEHF